MRLALAGVPLIIVVALGSGSARAQDEGLQEKIAQAAQMNREAFADIEKGEWEAARKIMLDALELEKKSGLDRHPLMARTYVHLGVVEILGFKDRKKGVRSFRHALEIQPDIRITKRIAISAELNDAFMEAGGAPERLALDCPVAQQARVDEAVPVRCAPDPRFPVTKVFLLYRDPAKRRFTAVEMKGSPEGWFQGRIPERVIYGDSVQFYFEGRNAEGQPIVKNGDQQSPNRIAIVKRESSALQ